MICSSAPTACSLRMNDATRLPNSCSDGSVIASATTDGATEMLARQTNMDDAVTAFVWYELSHNYLLFQNSERELELLAARNFVAPQLDAVGLYRWRGFGKHLLN